MSIPQWSVNFNCLDWIMFTCNLVVCLDKGKVTHGNDTDESIIIVTWGYRTDKDEITGTDKVKSLKNGLGKNKLVSVRTRFALSYNKSSSLFYLSKRLIHCTLFLNTYKHTNFVTVDNCSLFGVFFVFRSQIVHVLVFCELNVWQM